jgi:bla regulator protein blaR1
MMTGKYLRKFELRRSLSLRLAGLMALSFPIALGLINATQVQAQMQTDETAAKIPEYAVATIKPAKSDEGRVMMMFTPDGISVAGVPLQLLLREAFGVGDDRILGAPGWVKTDRFDLQAKVDGADVPKLLKLTMEQRRQMLIPLLADRFGLKFHHETRDLPVYALVIAKGGSRLKESKAPDAAAGGEPPRRMTMIRGRGNIEGQKSSIENLIHVLSEQLGRTIIDKTCLTGTYDYTLNWTPDDAPPMGGEPGGGPPGGNNAPPPDAGGPSVFTAIQEQLGLKLEPQKGPVDVIVIDGVAAPSEN